MLPTPKFFCPFLIGQKRQRHQGPGEEGTLYEEAVVMAGYQPGSTPLPSQKGFLMGNWGPEKMRQRWGKTSDPCLGGTLMAKAQISLPRGRRGAAKTKTEDGQG